MQETPALIRQLEESIRGGSPDQRVVTLRRVTDLFVHRAEQYDDEQVKLFDGVIGRLAAEIEKTALAELANRLAPVANAPQEIVRKLAKNDEISVAGALLTHSARLGEDDLVEIAGTKSEAHLLAICGREQIPAAVTDVLVERGGREVAHKVVANSGAMFSEAGFAKLVACAGDDVPLAEGVGGRVDVPPHLFRRLVTQATEQVQERLLAAARPEMRMAIRHVLSDISGKVAANPELASRSYSAARSYVQLLAQSGKLGPRVLVDLAKSGRFEETVAALAELAAVPIDIVDRVMHGDLAEPLLVLCRAKGFEWTTVRAVLLVRRNCRSLSPKELEQACQDYTTLSPSTAERVLRFWQVRQTNR
jgi:uncharacterized protein (DUF2336 family)